MSVLCDIQKKKHFYGFFAWVFCFLWVFCLGFAFYGCCLPQRARPVVEVVRGWHSVAELDVLSLIASPCVGVGRAPEGSKTLAHDWRIRDDLTVQDGRIERRTRAGGEGVVINTHLARAAVDGDDDSLVNRHQSTRSRVCHMHKNTTSGHDVVVVCHRLFG